MDVRFEKTTAPKEKPQDMSKVPFGSVFTDHMFMMDHDPENGWHDARIVPYGPISVMAGATVFHYAAEVFEGLKAYRKPDGSVQIFRPEENAKRMNNSAERMALPKMDVDMMVEAMVKLVEVEKDWVPTDPGTSLYIRPFLYANDEDLSLHPYTKSTFVIILSPVGPYFPDGLKPVPLLVEEEDVRAVRGGTGYAKCGGNYAGAMRAGARAEAKGYSQVLWIDGVERKYVEEAGGMNVMFRIDGKMVTPELNGSVLPGITRKSAIEIFEDWGDPVEEKAIPLDELLAAIKEDRVSDAFMIGTAAVICPISGLAYGDDLYEINNGDTAQKIYDAITNIQWGRAEDKYGWCVQVD